MTEQSNGRGEAEERAGVPHTPSEDNAPASPASTGGDASARGAAEEAADAPKTE